MRSTHVDGRGAPNSVQTWQTHQPPQQNAIGKCLPFSHCGVYTLQQQQHLSFSKMLPVRMCLPQIEVEYTANLRHAAALWPTTYPCASPDNARVMCGPPTMHHLVASYIMLVGARCTSTCHSTRRNRCAAVRKQACTCPRHELRALHYQVLFSLVPFQFFNANVESTVARAITHKQHSAVVALSTQRRALVFFGFA